MGQVRHEIVAVTVIGGVAEAVNCRCGVDIAPLVKHNPSERDITAALGLHVRTVTA